MGKKKELRRLMRKRDAEDTRAVVICVGKKCAPRAVSTALAEEARAYAATRHDVRIETAKCLDICEDGPIAATYPRIEFSRHVDVDRVHRLIDKVAHEGE